jgi:hypothetical protein
MEKSKTSVNIERYDSSAVTTRINRVDTRATTELQKVTSHLKMRIVRKELSPPDSLGNQYVEAEVTIIATADEDSTIEADIAEEEGEVIIIDSTSTSDIITDEYRDEVISQTTGPPWWQSGLIMIGLTSLILIVIKLVLKLL